MRHTLIGLLTLVFTAALTAAGDDLPQKPEPVPRLKKKARPPAAADEPREPKKELKPLPEGEAKLDPAQAKADERVKELLARIGKNMQASEDRLGQHDPGDGTQQIQGDILKDIDELLKPQQQQQNSSGGRSGSNRTQSAKQSQKSSPQSVKNNQPQPQQADPKGSKGQQPKKGGDPKEQMAKDDPKRAKEGGKSADKKSAFGDLFPGYWGDYPKKKRQKLNIYARERFLPRYDELLRQYYRAIAEQKRRLNGN
jgi:hypothetical protein